MRRRLSGSLAGVIRRENVGMSSEMGVRVPQAGSRRFPEQGMSAQGQSGPKPRPRGVGEGQQVQIPVLDINVRGKR